MLEQQARSAASCMVILAQVDVIDDFSPLFPYLLIYRTEEDAGSSPERSRGYSKQDGFRNVNHKSADLLGRASSCSWKCRSFYLSMF